MNKKLPFTGALIEQQLEDNKKIKYRVNRENEQKIKDSGIDFNVTATFTFKYEPKNEFEADKIFRVFMHKLNQAIHKRRYKSGEKRIKVVAMIEGRISQKRLHFHCVFELPESITLAEFKQLCKYYWTKSNKGYSSKVVVEEEYGIKWEGYIGKELTLRNTNAFSDNTCFGQNDRQGKV